MLAAYERELIGLVNAIRHWCLYLWGHTLVVRMDHYSLKFLLNQKLATIPQHQWASKLFGFHFRVEYKLGVANVVTDAFSSRDSGAESSLAALSTPEFTLFDDIRQEFDSNPTLQMIRDEIVAGERGDQWQVIDGLVTVAGKVYVHPTSTSLPIVVSWAHEMDHEGVEKPLHHLRGNFHVLGARWLIQDHVWACTICQKNKSEHLHPAGLLQPLDIPSTVWLDITMD
jgi:hypothetical protein